MTPGATGKPSGLRVLRAGPLSLLQDDGRLGCYQLGLTTGGPLDRLSFDWANRLCGNRAGTPALEITLGGLELEAEVPIRLAITGARAPIRLNGRAAECWRSYNLAPGDRFAIDMAERGCRLYLAVAGGFSAPPYLDSVATIVREGLGGHAGGGTPLNDGDVLVCEPSPADRCFAVPPSRQPACGGETVLHLIPCLDSRARLRSVKRHFLAQTYRVSAHADRMGYRLEGEALVGAGTTQLSAGLVPGTVQLPGDGQPIVLMHDHQTIGGYPRLGVVAGCDLRLLAQLRPGEPVRFVPITPDGALNLARRQWRDYERSCPVPVQG